MDQLIGPIQEGAHALSDDELVVLYSACYLHDIGMQYETADRTQVIQALNRIRIRGERSATVKDIVTEIYGTSLDEKTRTLALEPFIDEVLRKLAGDSKVAFERRSGSKRWYSVEQVAKRQISFTKTSTMVKVSVSAITI